MSKHGGSSMSSAQIARAAVNGRKVTFTYVGAGHTITGYVVQADDFHWLVAVPQTTGEGASLTLVHKSRADFINLHPSATLEDEPAPVREFVTEVGQGFWSFCKTHYLGHKAVPTPEMQPS